MATAYSSFSLLDIFFPVCLSRTLLYLRVCYKCLVYIMIMLDAWFKMPYPMRNSIVFVLRNLETKKCCSTFFTILMKFQWSKQVLEAKMIWVDRLGFDVRISCPQKGLFDVRIPFPTEVTDEKGAKSSFNCMSQQAWEVEKNYQSPNFKKVKHLKQIPYRGLWWIIF